MAQSLAGDPAGPSSTCCSRPSSALTPSAGYVAAGPAAPQRTHAVARRAARGHPLPAHRVGSAPARAILVQESDRRPAAGVAGTQPPATTRRARLPLSWTLGGGPDKLPEAGAPFLLNRSDASLDGGANRGSSRQASALEAEKQPAACALPWQPFKFIVLAGAHHDGGPSAHTNQIRAHGCAQHLGVAVPLRPDVVTFSSAQW